MEQDADTIILDKQLAVQFNEAKRQMGKIIHRIDELMNILHIKAETIEEHLVVEEKLIRGLKMIEDGAYIKLRGFLKELESEVQNVSHETSQTDR
jgi:uncharacterized protein YfbU (UPF0304 family)